MATVCLTRDLRHDRPVAVKVMDPELSAEIGSQRFSQEVRTTAQLNHPHTLPLFDSEEMRLINEPFLDPHAWVLYPVRADPRVGRVMDRVRKRVATLP